jgi:hypothetical protein
VGEEVTTIPPIVSGLPSVVSYTFTRWERFRTLVWMLPRSHLIRIFAVGIVPVVVWLVFNNAEGESVGVLLTTAAFELVILVIVLAGSLVLASFVSAFLATDRIVVGSITLTFSDDGFTAENAIAKSQFKWTAARDILTSDSFVFLRFSDTRFLGIPKRAFSDAQTADRFADSLRSRLEAAKRPAS